MLLMHMHFIILHIKRHIGHMKEVVRKILFDHIALIATTNNKFVNAMSRVNLHHMPKDWHSSNFDHGLRLEASLFR
ncbi:MAG: Uncharacterised protein [Gammaproteobacteria bacterium]|nr:MAG: Uncharacterised protein [Gammaproteobacteria bacterium]